MKYLCTHTHTHTERICGNTQSWSQKEVESWNTQSMGSSFCPHGKGLESSVLVASSLAVNSPLQKFKYSVVYWKGSSLLCTPLSPSPCPPTCPGRGSRFRAWGCMEQTWTCVVVTPVWPLRECTQGGDFSESQYWSTATNGKALALVVRKPFSVCPLSTDKAEGHGA